MAENRDRLQTEGRDEQTRVVVDGHGNEWTVHEVDTPQPWAHGKRCLIFSSASIVRRVWSYPSGWSRLSSRELLDLVGDITQPR
ncbi:MAG: hypothetical protein ABIP93_16300 [Gemmatimonadaceae bacterium]